MTLKTHYFSMTIWLNTTFELSIYKLFLSSATHWRFNLNSKLNNLLSGMGCYKELYELL